MRYRQVNEEVLYPSTPVVAVSANDVEELKHKQKSTTRKRVRLCAHHEISDAVHEMLIVHAADAYVRPHKHIGKSESYHVIEGCFDLILFDDHGAVTGVIELGPASSGRTFFCRLPAEQFHGLVIRSDNIVFHETTSGPFVRSQMEFASWAPDESEVAAGHEFMRQALRKYSSSGRL